MDFFSAVKLAKANEHLVGKNVDSNTIEEIIIIPTNEEDRKDFLAQFRRFMDAQRAITPFMKKDVEVFALFKKKCIRTDNLFITTCIRDLPEEIGVITHITSSEMNPD